MIANKIDYGIMSVQDVYKLAREFLKAKEGTKALNLSYDDRNMINVLSKQAFYGKFDESKITVGFLDLVGKDRVQLWKTLSDLSKEEAMDRYINLINKVCPLFYAHLEAHKRNLEEEQNRLREKEEEEQKQREMTEQKEKKLREEDLKLMEENKKKREEIQRKQIQEALNQQTYPHFKAYAEQQNPNNPQAQEELIKQLQEQHFEQYMNQVYQQQLLHQQQQAEQLRALKKSQKKQDPSPDDQFKKLTLNEINTSSSSITVNHESVNLTLISEKNESSQPNETTNLNTPETTSNIINMNGLSNEENPNVDNENDDEEDEIELPPISAASMLTRKDIKEFKDSVRRDNDAIIKVGSGETVTVRVPTHEDGRLIFWEFATDYYDLGFGLYFEWTISPSNNVTVHVSDSSDDEEGEDEEGGKQDPEKGDKSNENKPPCDEIIPIFRRDSHEEVYAGSHLYPGRGVYLLKFDNSYSLWRSKTLYYRVYYSK
ncbi:unnamed protein product [Brachionus calyciflorus]|uniref:Golgi resident protein GCP60 n=1 Tax=Brachionus calyciflorus TaxID=104777 RepID=A0A814GV95_9BILA|nr:unnamed protein product [Brachionus calyciflorus]